MGSFIEINDMLQFTNRQSFPTELDFEKHKDKPYTVEDFGGKIFKFRDKSKMRIYKAPPLRNFLVQNIRGKWLYWGLVCIIEISYDYTEQTISRKFKIIHIYTLNEMKEAHKLINRNTDTVFFN